MGRLGTVPVLFIIFFCLSVSGSGGRMDILHVHNRYWTGPCICQAASGYGRWSGILREGAWEWVGGLMRSLRLLICSSLDSSFRRIYILKTKQRMLHEELVCNARLLLAIE